MTGESSGGAILWSDATYVDAADVDRFDVLPFSRYLELVDRALLAWLEATGLGLAWLDQAEMEPRVRGARIRYRAAAGPGTRLITSLRVDHVGAAHARLGFVIAADVVCAEGEVELVVVSRRTAAAMLLPEEMTLAMARMEHDTYAQPDEIHGIHRVEAVAPSSPPDDPD